MLVRSTSTSTDTDFVPYLAVILAEPAEYPVISPLSTSATFSLLDVHSARSVTSLVVPSGYVAVTFTLSLLFNNRLTCCLSTSTRLTTSTLTSTVTLWLPTLAVITAVPALCPVTLPFTTVATFSSLVDHSAVLAAVLFVSLSLYVAVKIISFVSPVRKSRLCTFFERALTFFVTFT
ncbi:hypothetical protein D3C74_370060 [compost metagenome]